MMIFLCTYFTNKFFIFFGRYFGEPEELYNFFTNLEGDNLFLIQATQDIEKNLEEERHKFNNGTKLFSEKINKLKSNKRELG